MRFEDFVEYECYEFPDSINYYEEEEEKIVVSFFDYDDLVIEDLSLNELLEAVNKIYNVSYKPEIVEFLTIDGMSGELAILNKITNRFEEINIEDAVKFYHLREVIDYINEKRLRRKNNGNC